MVSLQDTEWKVFPRFLPLGHSTLLLGKDDSRSCVEIRNAKTGNEARLERQPGLARSTGLGRKLDPALKSWMDPSIIKEVNAVETASAIGEICGQPIFFAGARASQQLGNSMYL